MTYLIDKDALVVEIQGYISGYKDILSKVDEKCLKYAEGIEAKIDILQHLLSFLDTLEVKEVQESSAADRGMADEIIFALNTLGKEKMISYDKEIEWLRNKT